LQNGRDNLNELRLNRNIFIQQKLASYILPSLKNKVIEALIKNKSDPALTTKQTFYPCFN
jgi:hypothetical protein